MQQHKILLPLEKLNTLWQGNSRPDFPGQLKKSSKFISKSNHYKNNAHQYCVKVYSIIKMM